MQLTIHTIDDAPAASRPVLEAIAADVGAVPNLAAVAAGSPALVTGFDALRRATGSTRLDPVLREVAGLAVGVAVDNRYGIAFHSMVLGRLGADPDDVDAVRAGRPPAAARAAAVQTLATELVQRRGKVDDGTVGASRDAGLSDEEILDVVLECAFATMVGLVDNLAGHVELDGFLAPSRSQSLPATSTNTATRP